MFRVKQMIQDKTQTANNGMSLLGRAGKRWFALLRL